MKKHILFNLIFLIFVYCGTETEKVYYDNGNIKEEVTIKDGKEHGKWVQYYENGNVKYKGNYKDGKKHGVFSEYFGDYLKGRTVYRNDRPVRY